MTRAAPILALALLLSGCLSPPPGPDGTVDPDPYERSNRVVFAFNDGLDRFLLEPLGKGWRFITPELLRTALDDFFVNLEFPVRAVSCLGQARFEHAGWETVRFLTNSTIGLAGFWDPATRWFEIPYYDEDIGQMFGVWGIGSGPFWMVPFFGPLNPRDTVGLAADSFLNLLPYYGAPVAIINGRAIAVPTVERARESSLDYYLLVRDAYVQRRIRQVAERGPVTRYAEPFEDGADPYDDDLYDESLYDEDPEEIE